MADGTTAPLRELDGELRFGLEAPRVAPANVHADCGGHDEKSNNYAGEYQCWRVVFDKSHCLISSLAELD